MPLRLTSLMQYTTSVESGDTASTDDFTDADAATITIDAGDTSGIVNIEYDPGSDIDEDDETFTLTICQSVVQRRTREVRRPRQARFKTTIPQRLFCRKLLLFKSRKAEASNYTVVFGNRTKRSTVTIDLTPSIGRTCLTLEQ